VLPDDAEILPRTVEEARLAITEALMVEGASAARVLAHVFLLELQTVVPVDVLRSDAELQSTVAYLRKVRESLKARAFKEAYR
jgi:hypothetical protein